MNIQELILYELQITQTRHPLSISDEKNVLVQHPSKMKKKIMKCAQNRMVHIFNMCLIIRQSLNENFWSYRLHKLGTPKVLRTDGRTDRQTDGVDPLLDLLLLK